MGYTLPTGEAQETNRLDSQHEIFRIAFNGKQFLSPVHDPDAILDVGCGTSIWPIEVAKAYPLAMVTGLDLGGQTQPA